MSLTHPAYITQSVTWTLMHVEIVLMTEVLSGLMPLCVL